MLEQKNKSHIVRIKYKPGWGLNPTLFLVGNQTTREEFVAAVKKYDQDLDLRTVSLIEEVAAYTPKVQ